MVRRADEIAVVMSVFKEISGSTAGFPSKHIASLGNCNFKTYAEIKVPRLCSRYCIRKRTHARTFHIIYWVVGIFLITPVTQMHTYDELGYLKWMPLQYREHSTTHDCSMVEYQVLLIVIHFFKHSQSTTTVSCVPGFTLSLYNCFWLPGWGSRYKWCRSLFKAQVFHTKWKKTWNFWQCHTELNKRNKSSSDSLCCSLLFLPFS